MRHIVFAAALAALGGGTLLAKDPVAKEPAAKEKESPASLRFSIPGMT